MSSESFEALLRGEITAEEYVEGLRADARANRVNYFPPVQTDPSQEVAVSPEVVSTKRETVGVDPKVPIQAAVALVVALLAYFGVDFGPEVSGALALVAGAIAGVLAPAPKTVAVPSA